MEILCAFYKDWNRKRGFAHKDYVGSGHKPTLRINVDRKYRPKEFSKYKKIENNLNLPDFIM